MDNPTWTPTSRAQHRREGLRFPSDVTDAEWAVLAPLLPPPSPVGRPPAWPLREIVNAIFYILRAAFPGGCCRTASHRTRPSGAGSRAGVTAACGRV